MTVKPLVAFPDGGMYDLFDPEKLMGLRETVRVLDNICRFGGRGNRFYSVLAHSVDLSRAVPRELAKEALVHDFVEAYVGDLPAPVKHCPFMSAFVRLEQALEERVRAAFGVGRRSVCVKRMDARVASNEMIALGLAGDWFDAYVRETGLFPVDGYVVSGASAPGDAIPLFRARCLELGLRDWADELA